MLRAQLAAVLATVLALLPSTAATPDSGPPVQAGKKDAKPQDAPRFFIVAPERFHAELKEYVEHKQKLLNTELVSLEATLKATAGVDDPERLKRFLYDSWRRRHLKYVLLVGDIDVLPVRYMVLDRVTPAAIQESPRMNSPDTISRQAEAAVMDSGCLPPCLIVHKERICPHHRRTSTPRLPWVQI